MTDDAGDDLLESLSKVIGRFTHRSILCPADEYLRFMFSPPQPFLLLTVAQISSQVHFRCEQKHTPTP